MARNKHNVLHARSAPETDPKQLSRRAIVGFVPKTIDEKNRTVDFQLSSEAPVNVWDYERGDVVPEVLLSSGMRLPSNNQMPLLDTHDRSTIQKTHGSVRQIKIDGGNPVGKLFFARDDDSVDAFNKVTDGHITDGSVGYQVIRAFWIEEGQTMVFEGRTFAGPLKLSTEWLCKEFSLAPIGADENAKSRSDDAPPAKTDTPASTTKPSADRAESKTGGTFRMNPKLLALLISRGLAAGSTDEQALAFLSALPQADQDALRAEANKVESRNENLTELQKKQIREDAERATVQRIVDIEESCRTAGISVAEYRRNPAKFEAFTWQLSGNDGIDPAKEIAAFEQELRNRVNSRTRWCAERGKDFPEIAKEIQAENSELEQLGIFHDPATVPGAAPVVDPMNNDGSTTNGQE